MGPIALFDKSFMQALHIDEAAWFDHFFQTNICPIFYTETLADLKKEYEDRTPQQEVGKIARKFPDKNGFPCLHHEWLAKNNLLGFQAPMTGQIPAHGGLVKVAGKSCHVHNEIPEANDMQRWANQIFSLTEQEYASKWREDVSHIKFVEVAEAFKAAGYNRAKCKTLEEAKKEAEKLVIAPERIEANLELLFNQRADIDKILERWVRTGRKPLSLFAPYAAHVLTVETFFWVASAADLIPRDSHSWLDMCYLHYLPFCHVFVSFDKFHRRCAPLFKRDDQQFVWGDDLKKDLKGLNEHYLLLPEETRQKGMSFFAAVPPKEKPSLVADIWDIHLLGWRDRDEVRSWDIKKASSDVLERIAGISSATPLSRDQVDFNPQDTDGLLIKRQVRRKKDFWYQIPKGLKTEPKIKITVRFDINID